MSLKRWSYIVLLIGILNFIVILLSPVHIFFGVMGLFIMIFGIILSHMTCRCPKCDAFLNAGIIFEASKIERHCPRCGNPINTDTKIRL
jgi:capsule polysaccharide export protein KpsE/RkpR